MALYRNLVTDLLGYDKITTTAAKAKEVRILADKMVTLGKKGSLEARRAAHGFIYDSVVVGKIFNELAVRFKDRPGGYTRITKIGIRQGDAAPLVQIELIT
jgi:large subunit ribosomal protein L17